jgi:hypothetical protein
VKPHSNLRRHEHSKSPDMTEPTTASGRRRHPREKALDEFSKLVILVGYLWVVCELLSVHDSIVLSEVRLNFPELAFAIISSLVFAKVLLTRNWAWDIVLKLSRYVRPEPHPGPRESNLWATGSWIRSVRIRLSAPDGGLNWAGTRLGAFWSPSARLVVTGALVSFWILVANGWVLTFAVVNVLYKALDVEGETSSR